MAGRLSSPELLEWYRLLRVDVHERQAREKYDAEKADRLQRQQWDSVVARGAWEQRAKKRQPPPPVPSPPPPPPLNRDVLLHIASFLPSDSPLGPMARVWSHHGMTVLRQEALRRKWAVFSQVSRTLPGFQDDELWVHERLIPWGSEYARRKTAQEECAMIRIMTDQLDVLGRKGVLQTMDNNNVAIVALHPECNKSEPLSPLFQWGLGGYRDPTISGFPDMSILEWYYHVKQLEAEENDRVQWERWKREDAEQRRRDAEREQWRMREAEERETWLPYQRFIQQLDTSVLRRQQRAEERRLAQLAVPRLYSRKTDVKGWRTRQQPGFRISDPVQRQQQPTHEKAGRNQPVIGAFKHR